MFFNNRDFYVRLRGVYLINRGAFSGTFTADDRRYTSLALRLSGTTRFDDGKQCLVANPGSIIYLPRSLNFTREGGDEELRIIHLECVNVKGEEKVEEGMALFKPRDPELYAMCFQRIEKSWRAGRTNRASSQLYELFDMMEEEFSRGTDSSYQMIRDGVNYMRMHFQDPMLTVAMLAERCHISEVYFRKLYREAFGMSPHSGIVELRFEYAKQLLKSGYYTVAEVADMAGFADVKYFRSAFRQRFGISCSDYRKSKQKRENE